MPSPSSSTHSTHSVSSTPTPSSSATLSPGKRNKTKNHVYSSAEWKRQPTFAEVFFGLELPYRAPSNPVGAYLWKWRLWFETTFALSMLQPWEKVLIMIFANSVLFLFLTGVVFYLPSHVSVISKRAIYYLLGTEGTPTDLSFSHISQSLFRLIGGASRNATGVEL